MTSSLRGDQLNPWIVPKVQAADPAPRYVAVTGNTGSGKSTLVRAIAAALAREQSPAIGIDENSLHHPFIDRLFHAPEAYSFEIQLNFMLQRVMMVKRWIDAGYTVVMERSHLDDPVFIRHLLERGYVGEREHNIYMDLWRALERRMPLPDLLVYLSVSPDVSVQRLTAAETEGRRPAEFPDERTKKEWVSTWWRLYEERARELQNDPRYGPRVVRWSGETDSFALVVADTLDRIRGLGTGGH
jgi:deoxyadenosine/deoxycytidine kinase